MKKTVSAAALACALSLATAAAPLAQGREANMSQDQVKMAMISTQGSLPGSGPSSAGSSAVGSVSPVPLILGLMVIITIAATRGGMYYYPS
jgi:hypothetical protein